MIPMHCRKDKGAFVDRPFINWLGKKAKRHEHMKYHHDAMIATESFLNSVENPEQNVNNRLHDEGKIISEIGTLLNVFQKTVVDTAFPCVEINKVLNGESRGNTDNFLAALQIIANNDSICMGQERLSSLALIHNHYHVKIDLGEVVNPFATKHPRRLELGQS